ncbi:MAG: hypothetical protein HC798_01500 [Polaribacter sp.]|nr:hypothetical protein [Polaribacter sp.]
MAEPKGINEKGIGKETQPEVDTKDNALYASADDVLNDQPELKEFVIVKYGPEDIEVRTASLDATVLMTRFVGKYMKTAFESKSFKETINSARQGKEINDMEIVGLLFSILSENLEPNEIRKLMAVILRKEEAFIDKYFESHKFFEVMEAFMETNDFKKLFLGASRIFNRLTALQG